MVNIETLSRCISSSVEFGADGCRRPRPSSWEGSFFDAFQLPGSGIFALDRSLERRRVNFSGWEEAEVKR